MAFIAFGHGAELHVVGADGAGERRLAPGVVLTGVIARAPVWSRDGTRIAFAGGEVDQNGSAGASEVYVVSLADGTATRVIETRGAKSVPSWSPDGRSLVFVEQVPPPASVLARPRGRGPVRRLTPAHSWHESGLVARRQPDRVRQACQPARSVRDLHHPGGGRRRPPADQRHRRRRPRLRARPGRGAGRPRRSRRRGLRARVAALGSAA